MESALHVRHRRKGQNRRPSCRAVGGGETDSKSQDLNGLSHLVRVYNIDIWVWIEMLLGMKQKKNNDRSAVPICSFRAGCFGCRVLSTRQAIDIVPFSLPTSRGICIFALKWQECTREHENMRDSACTCMHVLASIDATGTWKSYAPAKY